MDFQQTVDKAVVNQHLQFTAEIWTKDMPPPPFVNKDKVKRVSKCVGNL